MEMQNKKVPMRKCVGCFEMKPKKELVRVVRSPEGEISLDSTSRKPGRGAYVCPDPECLAKARKKSSWSARSSAKYRMRFMTAWRRR